SETTLMYDGPAFDWHLQFKLHKIMECTAVEDQFVAQHVLPSIQTPLNNGVQLPCWSLCRSAHRPFNSHYLAYRSDTFSRGLAAEYSAPFNSNSLLNRSETWLQRLHQCGPVAFNSNSLLNRSETALTLQQKQHRYWLLSTQETRKYLGCYKSSEVCENTQS